MPTTSHNRSRAITQGDLAELAGVSRLTVNRALAGEPGLSEETRSRILELAGRHRYRPNAAARAIQSRRFGTVALLAGVAGADSYLPQQLLNALARACADSSLNLLYSYGRPLSGSLVQLMGELCCDGLIIGNFAHERQRLVAMVEQEPVPVVWLNNRGESDAIYPDEVAGGRLAVDHLVALGHRRLLYFHNRYRHTVQELGHFSEDDRLGGCVAQAAACGVDLAVEAAQHVRPDEDQATVAAVRRRLQAADRPTGVITYSEEELVIVIHLAAELGLRVPQDLSVIVFSWGHEHSLRTLLPTLVQPPAVSMARDALALMQQRWSANGSARPARVHQHSLVAGTTTGPLRAGLS